jgi:hypothetical protein
MSDLSLSQVLTIQGTEPDAPEKTLLIKSGASGASPITLDDLLIPKPASTVIFPVRNSSAIHLGISQGDMLIVDRDAIPNDDQLVIISTNEDLIISRYDEEMKLSIWGTVTYVISKQA